MGCKKGNIMRSVYYQITHFLTIREYRRLSDEMRGSKKPIIIEVPLKPIDGGSEFIIYVDVEMMSAFDHRAYIARGDTTPSGGKAREGRNSWIWETTIHVYGQTKFYGFRAGNKNTTVDLEFHITQGRGKLEAKIAKAV